MNDSDSSVSTLPAPSHEEIARRAQALWTSYGQPTGRDEEIWLEAERSLLTSSPSPVPSAKPLAAPSPRSNATATARMPAGGRRPRR